jgi:hypothetical protein
MNNKCTYNIDHSFITKGLLHLLIRDNPSKQESGGPEIESHNL